MVCQRLVGCPLWADLCRSGAMLEGGCPAQSCRPRCLKVTAGPRGSLPRTPLIVWITPFPLFLLTTEQSGHGSRFSVLRRPRELRWDVGAHQLASNATQLAS